MLFRSGDESQNSASEESDDEKTPKKKIKLSNSDDESDEDIFKIKKSGKAEEEGEKDSEEEEDSTKKKIKVVTKYATAKKIIKKKIKANTHVVFDADEVDEDEKETKFELNDDEENRGGINIEKAKEYMRNVDPMDKQAYKERIRKQKIEKKEKEKQRRLKLLKEENEEEAAYTGEFNPDDLPDPDECYGKIEKSDDEHSEEEKESSMSRSNTESESDSDEEDAIGLDIGDQEELALSLLKNS